MMGAMGYVPRLMGYALSVMWDAHVQKTRIFGHESIVMCKKHEKMDMRQEGVCTVLNVDI